MMVSVEGVVFSGVSIVVIAGASFADSLGEEHAEWDGHRWDEHQWADANEVEKGLEAAPHAKRHSKPLTRSSYVDLIIGDLLNDENAMGLMHLLANLLHHSEKIPFFFWGC